MFMSKPFTGGFTYQISVAGGGEEGRGGEGRAVLESTAALASSNFV